MDIGSGGECPPRLTAMLPGSAVKKFWERPLINRRSTMAAESGQRLFLAGIRFEHALCFPTIPHERGSVPRTVAREVRARDHAVPARQGR